MDRLLQKSTKESLKSRHANSKKLHSKAILNGSLLGILIAATPFIFYSYNLIPETRIWETIFFTYESGFYESAHLAFWMIMGKFVPLLLFVIWFFTCRHWWYHAILVPIAMYLYQLVGVIADDTIFFDNFDLLYLVPLMAFIIPSIYLIRAKMFNKINDADKTMKELEEEFMVKPKGFIGHLKQYF